MPINYHTLKFEGVTWGSLPNASVIKILLLESGGNTTCKTINSTKTSNSFSKTLSKWREIRITLLNMEKIKWHLIFSCVSVTKN